MKGIRTDNVPHTLDGPSIVAAASGLMLLPGNASRHVRLHRMAALGMALEDRGISRASSSAIRALLKTDDLGGPNVLQQEDPYSDVLVQSIDFPGGPYLVSPGSGEHTVSDIQNLIDTMVRERWMDSTLYRPTFHLTQALLIISNLILSRAGLKRGTLPQGSPGTPVDVPRADRLKEIASAAFISSDDLNKNAPWLRTVIDTFALDPGGLTDPCGSDVTDDRLYLHPFLRLQGGYQVVLPLDLLVTIRFHFMRFVRQAGQLDELGRRWRTAALHRVMRSLHYPRAAVLLEESDLTTRYLIPIDERRDLHVVLATDPLTNWNATVWDHMHDTQPSLDHLAHLMAPEKRQTYSTALTLLHLVITDSPGGYAFWGVPNVADSDPLLFVRSDDLEVMLHHEPDGPLGLLLFAEAQNKRPWGAFATDILDEFSFYEESNKSFYSSDDAQPSFMTLPAGQALNPRVKYQFEVDLHGVIPPINPKRIIPAQRLYRRDAPGIYVTDANNSNVWFVVELGANNIFITANRDEDKPVDTENELMECVSYWVWECASFIDSDPTEATVEIVLKITAPESWLNSIDPLNLDPAIRVTPISTGFTLEITEKFFTLLQEGDNIAERELVSALLRNLFTGSDTDSPEILNRVAPAGSKHMLTAFNQNQSPDMWAKRLPRPLTGHSQVTARLLDDLGDWLRSPSGGNFSTGVFKDNDRGEALNAAVSYLFDRLKSEIADYDPDHLLTYLIAQNESLIHNAKIVETMLRGRIACFGEDAVAVIDLVDAQKASDSTQRANRFLIEYVAACPPGGVLEVQNLDYYRLLAIAAEIAERGTASDFLYHRLADFEVSILESGRLGIERNHPIHQAIASYAANSGSRSLRDAKSEGPGDSLDGNLHDFDFNKFIELSAEATQAEFGFTFEEMREVCGGLLDLGAADQVNRVNRTLVINEISTGRKLSQEAVSRVLEKITLSPRESFMSIKYDAVPWRFNRDMSYVRRPVVQQGSDLVFGFRSIYRLGPNWVENILSGRLQARARTVEMTQFISRTRGRINDQFAQQTARKLESLGFTTRLMVKKIGNRRLVDPTGNEIGDIDILAIHEETNVIVAVEAKDFEIARTPAEIANEVEKIFGGRMGKRPTVELHSRRIEWLHENSSAIAIDLGFPANQPIKVLGAIVTSEPLITPLMRESQFPVIAIDDLTIESLGINTVQQRIRRKSGPGR